jgi:hypothetical protein
MQYLINVLFLLLYQVDEYKKYMNLHMIFVASLACKHTILLVRSIFFFKKPQMENERESQSSASSLPILAALHPRPDDYYKG